MYAGSGYNDWEIGDIDVVVNEGVYHLFHLIIPNHDYIAHAISYDGISWSRVKNALFVGDPGEWDDDMLWTMHVSKKGNQFLLFYTGLQRKDRRFAKNWIGGGFTYKATKKDNLKIGYLNILQNATSFDRLLLGITINTNPSKKK